MPENGTLQRKGTTTQGDAKRRKETVCKTRSCVEAEEGWSGEERIKVGGRLLAAVLSLWRQGLGLARREASAGEPNPLGLRCRPEAAEAPSSFNGAAL